MKTCRDTKWETFLLKIGNILLYLFGVFNKILTIVVLVWRLAKLVLLGTFFKQNPINFNTLLHKILFETKMSLKLANDSCLFDVFHKS